MRAAASILLFLVPPCFGYISLQTASVPSFPLRRVDNTAIQFYMNNLIVPGVQSTASGAAVTVISADSNPQAAIHAALATWNATNAPNVNFLPLQMTSAVSDGNDFQMTIAIGSTPADLSAIGGALAFTRNSYALGPSSVVNGQIVACSANCKYQAGDIFDSDIVFSPAMTFSTTGAAGTSDFQAVMTHEFGHALGANHAALLGGTMFQYTTVVERSLTADDVAFVNATYAGAAAAGNPGTLSGTVTGNGGSPIPYALLTMIDMAAGQTFGGLANADGTYSLEIPAGSYQVYAEPLNGIVQAPNLYFTAAQAAQIQNFQPTILEGAMSVTANNTATADIAVAAGTSSLAIPYVAVTTANGPVPGSFSTGGPALVASGQSVDLLLAGPGFEGSLSDADFAVYGQGISIHAGGVRLDPNHVTVGTYPVLRVTLDVTARQTQSLASLFVTKGSSTLSLSGALVVVPPTPGFTSRSIVNAASYQGSLNGDGAVSPGGIYALFDIPNLPNLGPVTPLGNAGKYDAYGFLASTLGGVTVTFDGVPAPLFFVYGGQINLQVPFEVAGKTSTNLVVNYLGSSSAAIAVPVLASQPAFYTTSATTAFIGNQYPDSTGNYTNSALAPASAGDYITVYGTGVGVSAYVIPTGAGAPTPPTYSADGFTCSIGGINTPVLFAGWTPTEVGLAQWNLRVPPSLTQTGAVPIACNNSNGSTQAGLTLFVK
jgi:uncharacterized protein (TIGR03437 family)